MSWVKTGFSTTTQLLGVLIFTNTSCIGQITPDATLGTESSQVNSHVMIRGLEADRIDGGAVRGSALFHSFSEFNVNNGQRVYFSNPAGITNIFTRVTGANLSHILGTLGVDGGANLFLLNPHGIKFGTNAQLDIQGSFVASTANSFVFPDGSEFNAKNPTAPPLLTMSATPGVQWGASGAGGTITNEGGNLTVGEDLTLSAGNLDLQGQLHALRDLTLFAQDTVKVRDSVTKPFIASAGRNFTVQGNGGIDILALNHPTQTPFVSGGNLSFISDGKISLDAHFSSGGNFAISPVSGGLANFVSLYDPIISTNGDVDVAASYTGTSLLVEATGNIRFQGDINITGADNNSLPLGPDTETLTKNSALILRSGQSTLAYGGVNFGNVPSYSNGTVPEGITLDGDVVLQPFNEIGGIVSLTAASGDVNTKLISTNGQKDVLNYGDDAIAIGGAINIEATKGSVNTGNLLSYSYSESGNVANGGAIALTAGGNITTTDIDSSSSYGNGGAIALTAGGNITTTDIDSSYSSGNGGEITIKADGNITTEKIDSGSGSFGTGNGGAITIKADGNITTKGIVSQSWYRNGGAIAIKADGNITTEDIYSSSGAGNGGAIDIKADGNITTKNINSSSGSRNGGEITIKADGNITTKNINSSSWYGNGEKITIKADGNITTEGIYSFSVEGNGGAIALTAGGNIVETTQIYSYSLYRNGGEITIKADGNITTNDINSSGKNGGEITIKADGNITTNDINSSFYEYSDRNFGNGGAIALTAGGNITAKGDFNSFSYSYSKSGNSGTGGAIFLSAKNGEIVGTPIEAYSYDDSQKDFVKKFRNPMLNSFSVSQHGTAGKGGNITIQAKNNVSNLDILTFSSSAEAGKVEVEGLGNLSLSDNKILTSGQLKVKIPNNGTITLDVGKAGQSGDVTIKSSGNLTFNNSSIESDTKGNASAGNVMITSPGLVTFNNSQIIANTSAQGNGGNINITGDSVTVSGDSKISASAENTGKGGSIDIQAETLKLDRGQIISESKQSEAGNINLKLNNLLLLRDNSTISTSAGTQNSEGNGGNIDINLKDGFVIAVPSENSDIIANAYGGNGGKINMRANRILGFQLQGREALDNIRKNGSSDISASSDVGTQGQVTVENLNVDPSQGLVQLSTQLIDPTGLIASACGGNSHTAKGQSEFVITGRGGLPPSPDDVLTAGTVPNTWVTSETETFSNNSSARPLVNSNAVSSPLDSAPLVEAQGMIRNANGDIVFTTQPPVNTLHQSALPAQFCHLTQK
ncbi:filamentous hemagglutinin N-terminal domain-containing protein [Anabaena lutea]|nr:filamentous hemagglutinin N-terminal domain-containing protein [Anabaena lutea]